MMVIVMVIILRKRNLKDSYFMLFSVFEVGRCRLFSSVMNGDL